jgi:intein/homing endonuclease
MFDAPALHVPFEGLSDGERVELEVELRDEIALTERDLRYIFEPDRVGEFDWLEGANESQRFDPILLSPSEFVSAAFRLPERVGGEYAPFSFTGRRHMYQPYDTACRQVLLCTARQCEKCVTVSTPVLLENGSRKAAGKVLVGDRLASLRVSTGGSRMGTGTVTWVSERRRKPCVKIETRQGHILKAATTHPVRTWDSWKDAGQVQVGDRLAVVREAGTFGDLEMPLERIRLTAYILGDGDLAKTVGFTQCPGPVLDEYLRDITAIGEEVRTYAKAGTKAVAVRTNHGQLYQWISEDGLIGHRSATKFVPAWVFQLPAYETALFINRLWATDGHVKQTHTSRYHICFCSISIRLVRDLQALLWKFGIPSRIRSYTPKLYKGTKKRAFILHIETQAGIHTFLETIGALGKSEDVALPTAEENNNRDTLPREVGHLIKKLSKQQPKLAKRGAKARGDKSLRAFGLRATPEYKLTRGKLAKYVEYFRTCPEVDQSAVELLAAHVYSDVYWDEVTSVTEIGEQECVDFDVSDQHNFVAGGIVTHNSTLLGNRLLTYSCLIPGYTSLFVSPSAAQTKTFSSDRLKVPIGLSRILGAYTSAALSMNVFEKQFINSSKITLRYAYLTADRTRGISAKALFLDELQHILSKNIPIIEECISHAPEEQRLQLYSGTPLSFDNVIEHTRTNRSTQAEWVIPCDAHGGEGGRYWNVLGVKNIQKAGLSCAKCGKLINAQHPDAQWAAQVAWDPKKTPFESYRISQLMAPWKKWTDILQSYANYSQAQFHNEVLGLSYDGGMRPLTQAQVKESCSSNVSMHPKYLAAYERHALVNDVYMGIDWGGGGSESSSYDVFTLMTYIDQRMRVFYAKRLVGEEAEPQNRLMIACDLIRRFNVKVVGADYGGGYDPNDHLIRTFGPERVLKFHYMSRLQDKLVWSSKLHRFLVHRSEVMTAVLSAIQRHQFEFPRWEEWEEPFAQDMINIHAEYNTKMRTLQYDVRPGLADDTFHSILFGFLASMTKTPRPGIIRPRREDPQQAVGFGPPPYEPLDQG